MSELNRLYRLLIDNMGVPDLHIPVAGVRIFRGNEPIPESIRAYITDNITLTSCQSLRQATLGDPVCLTRENIGCIAAAITFGIADKNEKEPFEGPRVYTDIMKAQGENEESFQPPTPDDFTQGIVYACKDADRMDFALFGEEDVGRFRTPEIAKNAIGDMLAIEPADTKGVFFFPYDYDEEPLTPDVVVMSIRPVELTRLVQAYQYNTGKRVTGSIGAVRAVNSDMIVRPYLTREINVSTYCVGARLIGKHEADRLGIGFPWEDFVETANGMKDSRTGFPFHLYPGADQF